MAWDADLEAKQEQVAMKAVRAAIDRIKETGASEEDAVRLLTARAQDPQAFESYFNPAPAPPPSAPPKPSDGYFMGAPISQMPGAPGFNPDIPPTPPNPLNEPRAAATPRMGGSKYPPMFQTAQSNLDTEDAFIGQGIADMRWQELGLQRPTSTSPLPLGQAGQETMSRNFIVPPETGQTPYYGAPMMVTDKGAFGHELTHAYQAEHVPDLDQFVETVKRLAAEGDVTAQTALIGYGQVGPGHPASGMQGAYQGASDPQHLFTQFIDFAQAGIEIPEELAPYYEGLFEGRPAQDILTKQMAPVKTRSMELIAKAQTQIVQAGSLRAAIETPQPVSALVTLIRAVTNNVVGQSLDMPDPETAERIRSMGLDDLEPEEILGRLVTAGFKIAVVDG